MLTAERRQAILGTLERDGKVVASELVLTLGVSEDTVRRDLRDLRPRDMIDIQSFLWVQGSSEYD